MKRAVGISSRNARSIETRFQAMNRNISSTMNGLGRTIGAAFAGAAALRGAQTLIDASTKIENSLKVAGLAGAELEAVYDNLFTSAQRNAAPLEALVDLYGRAALVQKELGVSTEELLGFTDKVAVALRVSGKSAAESSGALLQLSQALGSGVVRAEEFNSILEGALPIAQAAAAGLTEAGGSVAKLRQLVVDGKISSEAFFRAFEAGSSILTDKVANAELTVSQGFVRLQNVLIDTAGKFDDATGASGILAAGLDELASGAETFGTWLEENGGGIKEFFSDISDAIEATQRASRELGNSTGLSGFGRFVEDLTGLGVSSDYATGRVKRTADQIDRLTGGATEADLALAEAEQALATFALNSTDGFGALQPVVDDFIQQLLEGRGTAETAAVAIDAIGDAGDFDGLLTKLSGLVDGLFAVRSEAVATAAAVAATASGQNAQSNIAGQRAEQIASRPKVAPKPVSLSDYDPPGDSGGGSGSKQSLEESFKKAITAQREENRLLAEKTSLQAGLNPLVNDYGFAIERLNVQQELLSAAQAAGLEITPALRQSIDELATGYANASVEAAKLAESQEQLKQIAADFGEAGKSAIKGFISDLREGKSAADALGNAMSSILDSVIDIGLNALLGGLTGGGGGLFAGLFGFANGGYTGNGGKNEPAGVVHRGEFVMSAAATKRLGVANLERLHRGYANGGYVGSPGPVSGAGGGSASGALTVHIELDNELLNARVVNTAGKVVATAAPTIVKAANDGAPSAVTNAQARYG